MPSAIMQAIQQISEEKDISPASVIETIEAALAAAFAKDFGDKKVQNIKVNFDPETGNFDVFDIKTVVEDQELPMEGELAEEAAVEEHKPRIIITAGGASVEGPDAPLDGEEPVKKFNPKTEIMHTAARLTLKGDAEIGEEITTKLEVPSAFGRMAAQTAKQVIIQRLREAERNKLYGEFKNQEHELITATVTRVENGRVFLDLGRANGVMAPEEQIRGERYFPGGRMKVYVTDVRMTTRSPEISVSRSHPDVVRKMFGLEIPEVAAGTVKLHSVAREAGSRSKVAVSSTQENIDPIGSCIGQRGTRIQTIISELGGEKIDIIQHDEDPIKFITNALSPARVAHITLDDYSHMAEVIVPADQLSLAIGKGGQNVRLASRLTGWKINIRESNDLMAAVEETSAEQEETAAELASLVNEE